MKSIIQEKKNNPNNRFNRIALLSRFVLAASRPIRTNRANVRATG